MDTENTAVHCTVCGGIATGSEPARYGAHCTCEHGSCYEHGVPYKTAEQQKEGACDECAARCEEWMADKAKELPVLNLDDEMERAERLSQWMRMPTVEIRIVGTWEDEGMRRIHAGRRS